MKAKRLHIARLIMLTLPLCALIGGVAYLNWHEDDAAYTEAQLPPPKDAKPARDIRGAFPEQTDWESLSVAELPRGAFSETFLTTVRAVLSASPEMKWHTGSSGSTFGGAGNREKRVAENLEYCKRLADVPWPNVAVLKRIKLLSRPEQTDRFTLCWLVSPEEKSITILQDDLGASTISVADGARFEEIEYADELDELLDWLEATRGDADRPHTFTVYSGRGRPYHSGVFLLLHAYFAHCRGLHDRTAPLLRWAFYYEAAAVKKLFAERAWKTFEHGLLTLNRSGDRTLAREHWKRVISRFPDSRYKEQCAGYVRTLDRMIEEDASFQEPKSLENLSAEQKVAYWVHKLREVNAVQMSQPGHCHVLNLDKRSGNPAHQLAQLGKPAVPALIGLLEDDRLTRSYGYWRHFSPWRWVLQYRDAAIQTLELIANEDFYDPSSTSSYLSIEESEKQIDVIAKVNAWWKLNKDRDEPKWLRESLRKHGIGMGWRNIEAAKRLASLQRKKAIVFFRQRLRAEPDNPWAVQMLWLAGEAEVLPDVLTCAESDNLKMRVAAYRILEEAEHPQLLRLMLGDLRALTQDPEAGDGNESYAAEQLPRLLLATGQQAAREAVCQALRRRSMWMAIHSLDALSQVDEAWVLPHIAGVLEDNRGHHLYRDPEKDLFRLSDRAARILIRRRNLPWTLGSDAPIAERDVTIEKVRKWWTEQGAAR